jgi:hemoglobin
MHPKPAASSLFERIGGRPRLQHLLRHFYADVRQHREIGPIFTAKIKDWPAHLETIADFWSNVTGGPIKYDRPMPQKHFPLGLEERHFEAWLDLWGRHCRAHLRPTEAAEMIAAAEGIGQRLRWLVSRAERPPFPPGAPSAEIDPSGTEQPRSAIVD